MPNTVLDCESIHVAVGVITSGCGEILIARRPGGSHQGGLWEFPGGKLEPGEGVELALERELEEELGVQIECARPLIRIRHRYPDRSVLLDVWRVTAYRGSPIGREGQPLRWVLPERLLQYPFPPSNRSIVTAVRLPERYLITPEPEGDFLGFLSRLEHCLQAGVRLVQLRAKRLPADDYRRLAKRVVRIAGKYKAQILLNATPELVLETGADGIHLSAQRLLSLRQRPLPSSLWVAASCHNVTELVHAQGIGVDFGVVSPVLPTATHPHAAALGWERFRQLAEQAVFPVYALGGMSMQHLSLAHSYGAQGIAAIRAIWKEH